MDRGLISEADAVVLAVGFDRTREGETFDRSWSLTWAQEGLIEDVASLNKNTIVLLVTGSGVETEPWLEQVAGLMYGFYLGQSSGRALAEILYGKVNPGGKLPFTMAQKWDDILATKYYVDTPWLKNPYSILHETRSKDEFEVRHMKYGERLMVGYRHFDTNKVKPQFPFGHGLSYTDFKLYDFQMSGEVMGPGDSLTVRLKVTNTGKRAGSEVVQLYIHDKESGVIRPEKELKGFQKVFLKPGETKIVKLKIDSDDLKFFYSEYHKWTVEAGAYEVRLGTSSRDIAFRRYFQYLR